VSWFVYRGAGKVTFDPRRSRPGKTPGRARIPRGRLSAAAPKLPADGKQPVQVTFSEPGTYVLRCRADDGALVTDEDVTIVVTR